MDLTFANTSSERRFFFQQDQQLIRELHEHADAEKERENQRLHWMKCPRCGHDMNFQVVNAMTIEKCETCGGVFFDQSQIPNFFGPTQTSESFISTLHSLMVGEPKSS